MNKTRYCQFKGHEGNPMIYLCTYKDCKLGSKWICADCGVQPMLFQKKKDKRLIQICIKELQNLIQSTQYLILRLEEDLAAIQKNYNIEEIEEIINITKNNHFLLENKQIEKIVNLNNYDKKFQYNLSQVMLKQLIKINEDLQMLLVKNKLNPQLVYQRYFDHQQEQLILTSQISYNEKYLASAGCDCEIQVYNIVNQQLIKSIKIDNKVEICRFTKDSNYLLVGDFVGYLYCFDIKNNFNQQYKNQIHYEWIRDILPIDNDQIITCSSDKTIKITNIKEKTQKLLIINAHNSSINTVDFDQQNNVIISGSSDISIKFFNQTTGVMQFQKKDAHDNSVLINF